MDWTASLKRGPFSEVQTNKLVDLLPEFDSGQISWLNGFLTGIDTLLNEVAQPEVLQKQIAANANSEPPQSDPVWILYGTHTGNSEQLARQTVKKLDAIGRQTRLFDMESFKTRELKTIKELLIIVSTDGEGDPPPQAEELLEFLQSKKAPNLSHVHYSILALGDSSYTEFCQTGKDFDAALEKLGANKLTPRIDCDVDYEDNYEQWIEDILAKSKLSVGNNGSLVHVPEAPKANAAPAVVYNRKNPFPATVLKKINLNGRNSSKETIHLEIDINESGLKYEPGDALGIYALNSQKLVSSILEKLHFSGEETVTTHQGTKSLKEALISDYELTPLTAVSLKHYAELTGNKKLLKIAAENTEISKYVYGRDILDLINEDTFEFSPDVFLSILRKNMPRMYSISSSQKAVDNEVHVTVSTVRYEAYDRQREGHCSCFLSDRINEDEQVKIFVDPNTKFKLPEDPTRPIIMVGPGTGVAPFRAFVQDREMQGNAGKSWLFFGDRNFTTDFLYQTEWLSYLKEGVLTKADVAFSRDQDKKIYVQDRLFEQGKEIFEWLENGAYFYICGDKNHMAKDVDQALKTVVSNHGGMTKEKAAEYVKKLQKEGRYQTDVY